VDHRSVDRFEAIPPEYIQAAANLTMFYADRSVGDNLDDGLDCLEVPQPQAPNHCKRTNHRDPTYNTSPADVAWPGVYPRHNWQFVACTGTECVVEQYKLTPTQVFAYFPNYFEGPKLPGQVADTFQALLDLRAEHPGTILFAMTTSLPRGVEKGETDEQQTMLANDEIRAWAQNNGIPLLDAADILSHTPAGAPCYDNRDGVAYSLNERQQEDFPDDGNDIPALCPQYTSEALGGHLGNVSAGKIRLAKAMWVLMARLAGWSG
jgi:hypothetical protein